MNKNLLSSENLDCEKAREILNRNDVNASHLYLGANTLLIHIKDFNTMYALFNGAAWAISSVKKWWDVYINGGRKQFVLVNYQTAKTLDDVLHNPLSFVAFTFDEYTSNYVEAFDCLNDPIVCCEGLKVFDKMTDEALTKLGVTKEFVKRLLRYA